MNILITGGAGFIGRTLQEKLCELGHQVVLLDKKPPFILPKNVTYIQLDVRNQDKVLSIFKSTQFDGVVHLAAVSRVVDAQNNPEECQSVNVGGIDSVLNGIEKSKQKPWLIFGSSREVYGESSTLPVKENAPKNIVNIYGETKVKGESLFLEFAKTHRLSCAVVRFSNVYGNRYDIFDRVIPRFIMAIANDTPLVIEGGNQLIDFTHIDDSVNGILKIIEYLNATNNTQEAFHLCPGIGWSLQQLIDLIENALQKQATIHINPERNYDVVKFVGDTQKMKNLLGLSNFVTLETGINRCVNEYL